MDGLGEISEISQSEKDKYRMISLIYGIQWRNWTKKQNADRLIDAEQDGSLVEGRLGGGETEQKRKQTHGCGQ